MSEKIKTYKYFAFISYSRKDSKAAAWLQKRLEWFRFPVKLVPQDRRPPHERYVRPIYRDKTHLEVTDEHYWTNIKKALEESRYLIVLCSPHSAGSAPVNLEVDHFLETHDNDTSFIAPVIVGGSVTGDGDNAVLCPALHSLGESLIDRNLPTMVPDPGTAEQDAWEQGFVSLVSYLLSLERTTLGDHIQRETQRQARALRRWLTAVILLTFIAATVAGIAWQQRNRALSAEATSAQEAKRRKTLLEESSRADHEAARKLLDNGGWRGAVAHLDRALRFNPDNREAASHLWHIISYGSGTDGDRDMLPRRHFKHPRLVAGVWFAANDTRLVTLCDDGSVRLWALSDGRHEAVLSAGSVTALAVSPHGNLVAMGDLKGEITLCSAVDGRVVAKVKAHSQAIRSVAFDSEGTRLATAGDDRTASLHDALTLARIGDPMRHDDAVVRARFSPDGSAVLTASKDKTARLWSSRNAQAIGAPLQHPEEVEDAVVSPDGRLIATASGVQIHLWDASTRTRIGEPEVALGGIERLEFNPARSASLVLMMKNRTVVMWDCASNSAFFDAPSHGEALDIGRFSIGRITSFSHSADGMWLGTTGNDGTARVWRPDMSPFGHPVMRHEGGEASCTLWCLSFDQSGTRVATGGANGQACVWDLAANIGLAEPALPAEVSVLKDKLSPLARHEGRVVDTKDEQLMVTGEDGLSMSGLLGFEADGAVFASDGNRVLLRTGDDHNWNDVPFVRAPEWIHSFTTAICGARYLDGGKLKLESLAARLDELEKVKAAINDKDDSWAKLARWTITSASARTVSPLAKLTTGEIANGLFDALDGTANANADQVMRAVIEAQCHVPDHPLVALTQALLHPEERSTTLLRIGLRRLVTWVASGTLERRTAGTILSKIEAAWPGQLQSSQLRLLALTDTEAQQILALLPPGK